MFILLGLQVGCTHLPTAQLIAEQSQTTLQRYAGKPFLHQVFANSSANVQQQTQDSPRTLHIYIEGDGLPFYKTTEVSANPTPKKPMMMALMQQDTMPAIYLGRPCYFSPSDPNCEPIWWTHYRYHESVVDSMISVIDQFRGNYDQFVLLGFSGGGTLAMLIAQKLTGTTAVITIAGNLDTQAWTQHHRYSPMKGSLNPATQPALPLTINQTHYAGANDKNVLPLWTIRAIKRQPKARFVLLDNVDHNCCWPQHWSNILKEIEK